MYVKGLRYEGWHPIVSPAVTARQGRRHLLAESEQVGAQADVDMIQINEMPAPPEIAERLNHAGPVIVRSRRYSLDGTPVEAATSYIPADLAKGTPIADPNPGPGGIYARLEDLGHTLERFTEEVSARMPTEAEARLLAMMPGVPVFRLIRTAYRPRRPGCRGLRHHHVCRRLRPELRAARSLKPGPDGRRQNSSIRVRLL